MLVFSVERGRPLDSRQNGGTTAAT